MHDRLVHDHAWAIALHLVSVFENSLREEEKHQAFVECFRAARAGLETYEIMRNRQRSRLQGPSVN